MRVRCHLIVLLLLRVAGVHGKIVVGRSDAVVVGFGRFQRSVRHPVATDHHRENIRRQR